MSTPIVAHSTSNTRYSVALSDINQITSKRLPPYGKAVRPLAGRQLYIRIGWPPNRLRCDHMVLPDDKPWRYQWPVQACDVFVSPSLGPIPHETAQSLLDALVACGADSVVIFGTSVDDNGELYGLHFWPESLLTSRS